MNRLHQPTQDEVREALRANATCGEDGMWRFNNDSWPRTERSAMAIVEFCLIVGSPVTTHLSGSSLAVLARAVADLQASRETP